MMRNLRYALIGVAIVSILISCAFREISPPASPARVALVLGAGASRGFAHVGVLKVLEYYKIPIHMIVGTSAGSFVGSLYAFGYDAYQLQRMSIAIEKGDLLDFTVPDNGFLKGEKIENYVNCALRNTPLEKLRIPFYVVATDIQKGEEMIFGTGNTGTAVRASCAIPGIFKPVKIADRTFVDGGVVSPVAVEAARRLGADVVIAVDIAPGVENAAPKSTIETLLQSIDIMYSRIASIQLQRADVIIRPNVGSIGAADFSKRHAAILEGEKAAIDALPRIQQIVLRLKQENRL